MNGKIYIIKNYINTKAYIGQTQLSLKERFDTHKKLSRSNKTDKQYIHKAIFKHGEKTFYNLLNVVLPFDESKIAMLLFHLDMKGIAVSRGSACQSGSIRPSHVLAEMLNEEELKKPSLRISFSHYNTKEEIDSLISALNEI